MNKASREHAAFAESRLAAMLPRMSRACLPGVFGTKEEYPVARFEDVADLMSTGDSLQYSGPLYNPISLANRAFTYSKWSHSGGVIRFDEDTYVEGQGHMPAGLYVGDCRAIHGCKLWPLLPEIRKNPKRWCWSHVCRHRFPEFDDEKFKAALLSDVGNKYGYRGILLQVLTRTPVLQLGSLLLKVHRWPYFAKGPSYCSWGMKIWTAKAGANKNTGHTTTDPIPGRDGNLCPPEDIAEALIWSQPKVALVP
jgi:hypothetical protein